MPARKPSARKRNTPLTRSQRLGLVLAAGTLFAVTAGFWLAATLASAEYDSAPRCAGPAGPSCVAVESSVVESVEATAAGKSDDYWITLTGFGRIQMPSADKAYETAQPGDPATVTIWKGLVATIEVRGVTCATQDNPDEGSRDLTAILLATFGALLAAVLLAVRDRVRWLKVCGGAYPFWALLSGIAVGIGYAAGPFWLWPIVLAVSGIVAGLIALEFFVLQPRLAARNAAVEGWEAYL